MPSSSIEEALYTAPQSFDSEAQPALQLRASYRGKLHQLCIQGNGACTISQVGRIKDRRKANF